MKNYIKIIFLVVFINSFLNCFNKDQSITFLKSPKTNNPNITIELKNIFHEKYMYVIPSSIDDDNLYLLNMKFLIKDEENNEPKIGSDYLDKTITKDEYDNFLCEKKKDSILPVVHLA